jgi:hypothetical protein
VAPAGIAGRVSTTLAPLQIVELAGEISPMGVITVKLVVWPPTILFPQTSSIWSAVEKVDVRV